MTLTAYPVHGKAKSRDICAAFIAGANKVGAALADGAVFYGVDESNVSAWRAVKEAGQQWYYIDNSYFDPSRGTHFRVTVNGLQHSGLGRSDGKRFAALDIPIKPWRGAGEHVVVCPQSDAFMRTIAGFDGDWTRTTIEALQYFTERKLRVRAWNRDKMAAAGTLGDDLINAHALVTWSSAAAITALLAGIPVVCTGPCAASPMSGDVADIENLPWPEREQWAGVLADHQFTLDEFRSGYAWTRVATAPAHG